METTSSSPRQLGFFDCLGIGINGLIGTGIFLLPLVVWQSARELAPLAWLFIGSFCILVALCFAEVASRTEKSGGPYRYAFDVFGPNWGITIGIITLISAFLGFATVARGCSQSLVQFFAVSEHTKEILQLVISVTIVVGFGVLNVFGVKISSRAGFLLSLIKITTLVTFILLGLIAVGGKLPTISLAGLKNSFLELPSTIVTAAKSLGNDIWTILHGHWPHHSNSTTAITSTSVGLKGLVVGAFAGLFAVTGFEYIPVPAGEVIRPKQNIPLAILFSVVAVTLLYALTQWVADAGSAALDHMSPTQDVALAKVSDQLFGRFIAVSPGKIISIAALISGLGFCATSALVTPRYLESFAEDGFLPIQLHYRSKKYKTPIVAIGVVSVMVCMILLSRLPFGRLADACNVACLLQYAPTCIAVLIMRRRQKDSEKTFRIPFGPLVPVLAFIGCIGFLAWTPFNEVNRAPWQFYLILFALTLAGVGGSWWWRKKHSNDNGAMK